MRDEELLDVLAAAVAERLEEKRRWVTLEGLAGYLGGISVRQARGLREQGLPAVNGKPLIFDLREVDRWMEQRGPL